MIKDSNPYNIFDWFSPITYNLNIEKLKKSYKKLI